jgi:urease accessory protein
MMSTDQSADWVASLLQVSDPLFPTGAYAHSMGLEQWALTCGYRSGEDLVSFFRTHAGPALARLELPYLRYLNAAILADDWDAVSELDAEIDAWKWSAEIREASIAQGRGRLRLLKQLWPQAARLQRYLRALGASQVRGHHLVVTALQFDLLDVPEDAGLLAYSYQNLANYVSASVKLLRISPEAAQLALHTALEQLPEWVAESKLIEHEDAGWFAPAFDMSSARHATAFSRLFIS